MLMKQANPQGVLSPNGLLPAGHAIVPVDAEGWKCVCTCMDVYAHGCTQTYTHAGMHIHMNTCVCVRAQSYSMKTHGPISLPTQWAPAPAFPQTEESREA